MFEQFIQNPKDPNKENETDLKKKNHPKPDPDEDELNETPDDNEETDETPEDDEKDLIDELNEYFEKQKTKIRKL